MSTIRDFRRGDVLLFLACVCILIVIVPLLASVGQGALVVALIAMPILALILTRRAVNAPYLSPTFMVGAFFTFIGVGGYLLRDLLASAGSRGAGIAIMLSEAESFNTLALISTMTTVTVLASYISIKAVAKRDHGIREFR